MLQPALLALLLGSGVQVAAAARPDVTRDPAPVQAHVGHYLPAALHGNVPRAATGPPLAGLPLVTEDIARLLVVSVDQRVLGAIRDGVGVTFSMGNLGGLHLNLYSRRNPRGRGMRWDLNQPEREPRFWSFGGTLDLVRESDGDRQVVFVPQLLLNFDALTKKSNHFQALVQYAHWRPTAGQGAPDDAVPQVSVRLRY